MRYVECPRDAWQGLPKLIATQEKRAHLKRLVEAGFTHLDLGSFVSPKAVPQLADTEEVLRGLERPAGVDFLAIVANEKGLERALIVPQVSSVGYPLSVNDSFQKRNTGRSLEASWPLVTALAARASQEGLGFVVYLSMGFGNPYGEPWTAKDTARAVTRLRELGILQIALADTAGTATPKRMKEVLREVEAPEALGLHLHARPDDWQEKLEVALGFGLRWLEGALGGLGGCPFADDKLVSNLPTERVLPWLAARGLEVGVKLPSLPALAEDAKRVAATGENTGK